MEPHFPTESSTLTAAAAGQRRYISTILAQKSWQCGRILAIFASWQFLAPPHRCRPLRCGAAPRQVGIPGNPNDSLCDGIADFFLACSASRRQRADWPSLEALQSAEAVITFSHFIPRPELYGGYHSMAKVMGCCEIDDELRACQATSHIFGHSHLPVDATVGTPRVRCGLCCCCFALNAFAFF